MLTPCWLVKGAMVYLPWGVGELPPTITAAFRKVRASLPLAGPWTRVQSFENPRAEMRVRTRDLLFETPPELAA